MPSPLADRNDTERAYSQCSILRRRLQFQSSSQKTIALSPEHDAIHSTYLEYIEPMLEYEWIDDIVAHRRSTSRKNLDDLQLLQDHLCTSALHKTQILKYVVRKWIDDQELKKSLALLQEHISAVCTYEISKHWGQSQPEHKDYMDAFYEDWLNDLPDEDEDRSRDIACCIVVLLMKGLFCDVSSYPNLQAGIKDIVYSRHKISLKREPQPKQVIDLTDS